MSTPLTTIFFIPSLGGGGAEMNLLRLLNNLDRSQIKPILAVANPGGSYEKKLLKDVEVYYMTNGKWPSSTMRLLASILPLRKLVLKKQADIVCSFLDPANIAALTATAFISNLCRIVGVQNTPSVQYSGTNNIFGKGILFLIKKLYPHATKIVALSEGVATDLKKALPANACKNLCIIHNSGFDEHIVKASREKVSEDYFQSSPVIVACGRLVEQKAFPFLIEAFSKVRQKREARLVILGEGEQRKLLETQILELGLENDVYLPGFQDNPYKYMATADVFVLSSIFEGFGNVLVEAMTCGTAVVSTDCPSGPSEIITHEVNGLLTPVLDSKILADSIIRLLDDEGLRKRLVNAGQRRAQDFNVSNIANEYAALFEQTKACKKKAKSI